jgi:hypothetical protein
MPEKSSKFSEQQGRWGRDAHGLRRRGQAKLWELIREPALTIAFLCSYHHGNKGLTQLPMQSESEESLLLQFVYLQYLINLSSFLWMHQAFCGRDKKDKRMQGIYYLTAHTAKRCICSSSPHKIGMTKFSLVILKCWWIIFIVCPFPNKNLYLSHFGHSREQTNHMSQNRNM